MSAIKYDFNIANLASRIFQMDRWGYPAYTIQIANGSALVEGTLQRINQGEVPTWFTLDDQSGTAITALAAGAASIQDTTPIDSIRITATGATSGTVIQTGS